MHVRQSYSVSLCTCFGAKTLHNINNLGLCIRVQVKSFIVDLRHKFTVRNMNEIPVLVQSSELSNRT